MTATFDDVILQSQPAFYSDGAVGFGTAGVTWRWILESPAGLDADWSDVTFECELLDPDDADQVVLVVTMTADEENRITIGATATQTGTLNQDNQERIIVYPWRARAIKGDDVVAMWNARPSEFTVFPSGYEAEVVEGP